MKRKLKRGTHVDASVVQLRAVLKALCRRRDGLVKAGIWNTNLHLVGKAGNKMIAKDPAKDGQRKYTYIGTDQKKQQAARDQVKRYHQHEDVCRAIDRCNGDLDNVLEELDRVASEAADAVKDSKQLLRVQHD